MRTIVLIAGLALLAPALAGAQVPAQTPPPREGAADWQRPSATTAEYTAGAKKSVDELAAKLPEARQRANERGRQDQMPRFDEVQRKLDTVRQQLNKLPQTNQANWDTERTNFELAYKDLMRSWDEASK